MSRDMTIERAEELLACACGDISAAVAAVDLLDPATSKPYKRHLADALVRVWEAREALFAMRPDLRPPSMPHPVTR
jgi:hypothetical protein